jgi:hypothetical protein
MINNHFPCSPESYSPSSPYWPYCICLGSRVCATCDARNTNSGRFLQHTKLYPNGQNKPRRRLPMREPHIVLSRRPNSLWSGATYLLKTKRSPRSEILWWSLSNVELVRSGVLAAESNTINEKRTKRLAISIVEKSLIRPP